MDLGRFNVDYLADLSQIVNRIGADLFFRQVRTSGLIATTRITHHGGVVTDDNHGLVSEFLELSDLSQWDRMSKVNIDPRWIDSVLNSQRNTGVATVLKFLRQFVFRDNLFHATTYDLQLLCDRRK